MQFTITVYFHKAGNTPRNYSYLTLPEATMNALHYSKKTEVRKVSLSISLGEYHNGQYMRTL